MTTFKRDDPYQLVRDRLSGIYWDPDPARTQQRIVDLLQETLPAYGWVGMYLIEEDDLVLGAWHGPQATEHVRIPIGQGICGWAAKYRETVIVDDVNADPRYLACFTTTRAEIVVPIMQDGVVYGEIDIDGDQRGAFGTADQALLEEIAEQLARIFSGERSPTVDAPSDAAEGPA